MTAIQQQPPSRRDVRFEIAGALSIATAAVAAASQAVRSVTAQLVSHQNDPAVEVGRRLLALRSGNATERELARFITRCFDVAEATHDRAVENAAPPAPRSGNGLSAALGGIAMKSPKSSERRVGDDREPAANPDIIDDPVEHAPSAYAVALSGVDAFETILSAAEAGKARAVTEAYAHAREEIVDPTLSPGQRVKHTDGRIDRVLSSTQITGADVSVILGQSPGLAKSTVTRATKLVQYMPHTLARLERGELTSYQLRLLTDEAFAMPPQLVERLDELVSGAPFTGRHVGLGDHRASMTAFRRRLNNAVAAIGFEPPEKNTRKAGFAGRYVRFGVTGADGMTSLHGCLPSLHAKAIDTLLDDLARTASDNKADERTIDQRRADALMTCFTGPAALSPAGQLALDVSAASFDEHGQYVVVDEQQNLQAQAIWATIQLLAASLELTFPDVPKATVTVDVTLETLTDAPCGSPTATPPAPAPEAPGAQEAPDAAQEMADAPPGGTEPMRPADSAGGQVCSPPGTPVPPRSSLSPFTAIPPDRSNTPRIERASGASYTDTNIANRAAATTACCDPLLREASPAGAAARHRAATLRGVGDIPASLARRLMRFADLQRIVTDALTGQPLEVGRRHPDRKLRTAIHNRDRHCRFPGCTRTAALDLDHLTPYRDDGPPKAQTAPHTLECLCREHHRVKHQLHWTPDMQPDGSILWRNNLLHLTATS